MADNGQIDNVYLNFEVGGNANDEFDKMDKGLENIENNAKEAIEALESFANISKIDVLNKKLENVNKSLDEAVTKNKGLDDSGVLGDLTKRFSLVDKIIITPMLHNAILNLNFFAPLTHLPTWRCNSIANSLFAIAVYILYHNFCHLSIALCKIFFAMLF